MERDDIDALFDVAISRRKVTLNDSVRAVAMTRELKTNFQNYLEWKGKIVALEEELENRDMPYHIGVEIAARVEVSVSNLVTLALAIAEQVVDNPQLIFKRPDNESVCSDPDN